MEQYLRKVLFLTHRAVVTLMDAHDKITYSPGQTITYSGKGPLIVSTFEKRPPFRSNKSGGKNLPSSLICSRQIPTLE